MTEKTGKSDTPEGTDASGLSLFSVPELVLDVCRSLRGADEIGYVVGGSLRDLLRGVPPLDWDVATTATPERVMRLFRRTVPTGVRHGTVTVLVGDASIEVTTLRGEGAYSDGRRPDDVVFLDDIEQDLARRDFTINAMAFEPLAGAFFDPFGGRADLGARAIRAVGDPLARFTEDGLRVLRAARFAATLEFDIEPGTRAAIFTAAQGLAHVSSERKRDELRKLLLAKTPSRGLEVIAGAGLLPFVCPELAARIGADPTPAERGRVTWSRVDTVEPDLVLRLQALFHDLSPEAADTATAALKLDSVTRRAIVAASAAALIDLDRPWTPADIRRSLGAHGARPILDRLTVARADLAARALSTDGLDRLRAETEAQLAARVPLAVGDLAVKGRDLIDALEMAPGPDLGRLLDALLEHVLERPEDNSREALLGLARRAAPK
jgi:tRNA nucleotidyltransferase (CCA-adding enzyme)